MKKRRIVVLILLLMLIFSLTSCSVFNKKPIQIGFVGTLQGPTADLALNGRRGVEIAIDEINADGGIDGRPVVLVVKDSINDVMVSKDIVADFVEEGIELVIGEYFSSLMAGYSLKSIRTISST